ncbi:MAG TPA: tetratricopeptide repeat protein, partial [Candidatus Obscuribacter sp.]|nr:tetratricopeptide repeat protein [Candidatus Obscuribacter sp.]
MKFKYIALCALQFLAFAAPGGAQETTWSQDLEVGSMAYRQGKYAVAELAFSEALTKAEKFGAEDVRVATTLNNLALVCETQGKYVEAEPLYKRALAIYEKVRGAEHPDLATAMNNLALVYEAQGKYTEAEPIFQQALTIQKKCFGAEHASVAN